jgi:hypothetical protein
MYYAITALKYTSNGIVLLRVPYISCYGTQQSVKPHRDLTACGLLP